MNTPQGSMGVGLAELQKQIANALYDNRRDYLWDFLGIFPEEPTESSDLWKACYAEADQWIGALCKAGYTKDATCYRLFVAPVADEELIEK